MDGEPPEPPESRSETAPVIGSVEMQESDVAPAIVQMSPIYRVRWLGALWAAWYGVSMALGSAPGKMVVPLVASGVVLAFLFIMPRLTARRLVQSLARGGDRHISYRFDEEGVTLRAAGVTTTYAYRKLVKVREVRTALLLYTSALLANIVPKRAFSEADLARVRIYLAPYMKAGAKGGRKVVLLVVTWLALMVVFMAIWQYLSANPHG